MYFQKYHRGIIMVCVPMRVAVRKGKDFRWAAVGIVRNWNCIVSDVLLSSPTPVYDITEAVEQFWLLATPYADALADRLGFDNPQ
jgi:hypothetical protein